jgi:predicted acetyltransferase
LAPASTTSIPEGVAELLLELGQGENGFGGEITFLAGNLSLHDYMQTLVDAAQGKGLPEGYVPMTTSWLVGASGRAVGMSRLRHQLTPFLLEKGGNIGYYIKKSERGKGLGTLILSETLKLAQGLGLKRVLVSTWADNLPSCRVIEANGGVLEDEREAPAQTRRFRRYWIELPESSVTSAAAERTAVRHSADAGP